ncbi:MAG TPA: J domain-containing protein [Chloroflexota bacterium]|nr:J domain-containing protein [Chloroflexota bacterium]
MAGEYKDYYRILGVDRRADERQIKAAFRRLARQYHPDVNPGDRRAEERFKDVSEAYEVLGDPEKRRRYDLLGPLNWARSAANGAAGRNGPRPGQSAFDFFQGVFSSAGARRSRGRRGRDVEQDVTVTLHEAFSGSSRVFQVQGEDHCERCDGTGRAAAGKPCAACGGSGLVAYTRNIEVKIPAGVRDGSRIRIANEGGAGAEGGQRGDIYFRVHIRPDEVFTRQEDDLLTDLDVPYTLLVLGGEVEVPTLGRPVRMKVPPTTANGCSFRLARLGMPHLGADGRGDLIVRVNAVLPHKISDRQRRLFEELQMLEQE